MPERTKTKRLVSELIDFYFAHDSMDIELIIENNEHQTRITISGDYKESMTSVLNSLTPKRQAEVEDLYEPLLGSGHDEDTLDLLEYFVDEIEVNKYQDHLSISVIRKH